MDVKRDRSKSFSNKNEIFYIGDQLRTRINFSNLLKDRKYHFKTYKNCFVGKEVVSWLVDCKLCDSRSSAVTALRTLQDHHILHHVCDDHLFKDDMLFYRFRIDDGTHKMDMDLKMFHKGQQIYRLATSKKKGIIRDYQLNAQVYKDAFIGSAFVDWLTNQEHIGIEDAVDLGRKLLDYNIIKHVTDDHHFKHDNCLLYQFEFDFDQKFTFNNVFKFSLPTHSRNFSDSSLIVKDFNRKRSASSEKSHSSVDSHDEFDPNRRFSDSYTCSIHDKISVTSSDNESVDGSESIDGDSSLTSPKSVLLRHATVAELVSPETPYIKRSLRITSDSVGYGFVVRGDGPTYVQTIDPLGPAAAAGLKVRQYIHSVNGNNVLKLNHKQVAKMIMDVEQYLTICIMVHKRDAVFTDIDSLKTT
ncbi:DEP domain-containing mTOR-interacting protein-like [Mytilus trossulus]|uniref:DEP domain-containing mTOR-interacting protein-like n=1 Tax=Mytilus trossulus TaxID=6551 RepID=UPI003004AFDC